MLLLILGLLIFLGVHSIRIVAESWRATQIARIGERAWKGSFALAATIGLALIIWGYGLARAHPVILWIPPTAARHIAAPLTALAFILLAAAYVPRNRIKTFIGHPMLAGIFLWALAHLLANGALSATVLFGAFLVWAATDFASARRRDRLAGTLYPAGTIASDASAVTVGLAAWVLFAFLLHGWLIGVQPFARLN